ncbi:MAG TPA: hypothetical protein VG844_11255 [Terracidiphilus sp.]|nr:hypothetical protein [Terracidiphilus sp.]
MTDKMEELELRERLSLIEAMIAEGRRTTERWGWSFVLWGVAYYVAIAWTSFGKSEIAWPVTMIAAFVVTLALAARKMRGKTATTAGRAVGAVWRGVGISLFVVLFALSMGGHVEQHTFAAIVGGLLGAANSISSMILRWKMQFAVAVVWWAMAVAVSFGSDRVMEIAFLTALFFCQIVFGVYCMIAESRKCKSGGLAHA